MTDLEMWQKIWDSFQEPIVIPSHFDREQWKKTRKMFENGLKTLKPEGDKQS